MEEGARLKNTKFEKLSRYGKIILQWLVFTQHSLKGYSNNTWHFSDPQPPVWHFSLLDHWFLGINCLKISNELERKYLFPSECHVLFEWPPTQPKKFLRPLWVKPQKSFTKLTEFPSNGRNLVSSKFKSSRAELTLTGEIDLTLAIDLFLQEQVVFLLKNTIKSEKTPRR